MKLDHRFNRGDQVLLPSGNLGTIRCTPFWWGDTVNVATRAYDCTPAKERVRRVLVAFAGVVER